MADWYGQSRSNYFSVKNLNKFKAFCDKFNLEFIAKGGKAGFISNEEFGRIPDGYFDEKKDDFVDVDFTLELSKHLVSGEVAIYMECGAEKHRYLTGYACAVNSKGENLSVGLHEIYKKAKKLGSNITECEY